jgi:hypothetical protein
VDPGVILGAMDELEGSRVLLVTEAGLADTDADCHSAAESLHESSARHVSSIVLRCRGETRWCDQTNA